MRHYNQARGAFMTRYLRFGSLGEGGPSRLGDERDNLMHRPPSPRIQIDANFEVRSPKIPDVL